jgi:hypothetical protein
MTGIEIIKAPSSTAGEIADIIAEHCPPAIPTTCDRLSCRECWLAWLVTGEAAKETGPSDERTAPGDAPTYYRPPIEAIRAAAERVRAGNLEYTADDLTRRREP